MGFRLKLANIPKHALRSFLNKWIGGNEVTDKIKALGLLKEHGLRAYVYMPANGIEDKNLADAIRLLGDCGCIITDLKGNTIGSCVPIQQTQDELVAARRAQFKLVEK